MVYARRAAGQDDAFRFQRVNLVEGKIERMDFTVDVGFANAPRDELRVL